MDTEMILGLSFVFWAVYIIGIGVVAIFTTDGPHDWPNRPYWIFWWPLWCLVMFPVKITKGLKNIPLHASLLYNDVKKEWNK